MGHIGNQIGLQALVPDTLLHRGRQTAAHLVDRLRENPVIAADLSHGNLRVQLPCGDPLDAVQDPLPLGRLFQHKDAHANIKEHHQKYSKFAQRPEHNINQPESHIGNHGLRGGFPVLHHFPKGTADLIQNTVFPQGMGLDSAHKTDVADEKHQIQYKGHASAHHGKFRHLQISYRHADGHQEQDNPGRHNQNQRRQFRPYPVKAVQHNLAILVGAASCCQGQIHHGQQIQDSSQHHSVDCHPAHRRDFLILLLILGQLITRLIPGIHSYHQNIIPFHGRRIALHIAAQLA